MMPAADSATLNYFPNRAVVEINKWKVEIAKIFLDLCLCICLHCLFVSVDCSESFDTMQTVIKMNGIDLCDVPFWFCSLVYCPNCMRFIELR